MFDSTVSLISIGLAILGLLLRIVTVQLRDEHDVEPERVRLLKQASALFLFASWISILVLLVGSLVSIFPVFSMDSIDQITTEFVYNIFLFCIGLILFIGFSTLAGATGLLKDVEEALGKAKEQVVFKYIRLNQEEGITAECIIARINHSLQPASESKKLSLLKIARDFNSNASVRIFLTLAGADDLLAVLARLVPGENEIKEILEKLKKKKITNISENLFIISDIPEMEKAGVIKFVGPRNWIKKKFTDIGQQYEFVKKKDPAEKKNNANGK